VGLIFLGLSDVGRVGFSSMGVAQVWWVWLRSVGRAVCSGWSSHQALQDSLCGVELPGSRMTHVLLIVQVKDGEVDDERHQERA
jgi:hypothetical protein